MPAAVTLLPLAQIVANFSHMQKLHNFMVVWGGAVHLHLHTSEQKQYAGEKYMVKFT